MKIKVSHSKPTLSGSEIKAVSAVLRSSYIAKGKGVDSFERRFCQYQGVKGAVAVNSGSSALHVALIALGVKEKDEVIIPSYACTALLNAVLYTGARPVIVDVNKDDLNISINEVQKSLTRKTKVIIVVHSFGLPADMVLFKRLGIPIIEDCTHAIGTKCAGRKVGSFGDISIYSFYATKMMTTGEGGMITSNKIGVINTVRDLIDYDNHKIFRIRYNYKMSDLQAVMGIEQLKKLSYFMVQRRKLARYYNQLLKDAPCRVPLDFKNRKHGYFRYIIRMNKTNKLKRVIYKMNRVGIECRNPVYQPLHKFWKSRKCPVSDALMQTAISLPIYPSLSLNQVQRISQYIISQLTTI